MTDKLPVSKKGFSADWFLQGALTRIGDTVDRFTGRRWMPSSSLATSELVERMKRLLDSESKEIAGKGVVVPHNIKLKVQWDKFATDADDALIKLEHELLNAAADHINDKLYYTHAPLIVEVKPDYFTEGVKLFVSYDNFSEEENEAELNVTIPSINLGQLHEVETAAVRPSGTVFIARFELNGSQRDRRIVFPPSGRLSVGRTGSNDLAIDDVSVSKIHASLAVDADANLSVSDTGSTNGTFINDERISYGKAPRINAGDRVKFGMVDVVFEHIRQESDAAAEEIPVSRASSTAEVLEKAPSATHEGSPAHETHEKTLEIDPVNHQNHPGVTKEADE